MGTVFSFDVRDAGRGRRRAAVEDALREAVVWLHRVDAVFSPYREDSQISRLDRGETALGECDPDVALVLEWCEEASRETGGWFTARPAGRLDPCGLVKGWAVEQAARLLREAGSRSHSVTGGGDVQTTGGPAPGRPWRIGVAHPLLPGRLAAVVSGYGIAVATSGTAERGAHITDPHTGRPATALASVTVVGTGLTEADTWATAAFAMGPACVARLEAREGLEALAVLPDGALRRTSGFPDAPEAPDAPRAAPARASADPGEWRPAVPSALGQQ
ncbi:FAD:protein FMN transferase [Streptacidiphilus sp. ASG 303]|uniref:FAD:protein FMN transferase n=1 Tax=Streptacidiphilus sp. ASG 303 TaxID=2896847 RepID=UPI001E2BA69D|nr:FAD:protein FMN transferase [Streptacidiphilus sp. ASG 303]MCD0484453.1 FAD:protein FMN transferase [Streptacidiphilus sp. ASG 303]